MSLETLKGSLKEDTNFQRYRSIRQTASKALPYEKLCEELDRIMAARQVRSFATSSLQPRELLSVSMDEISHRARTTEILVTAKRRRHDLATVIDAVWTHVTVTYADELRDFKTKGEREAAVTSCFSLGYNLLSSLDSLIDQCETIMKDIDQTSFSLSRIASMFELTIRNGHLVNVEA